MRKLLLIFALLSACGLCSAQVVDTIAAEGGSSPAKLESTSKPVETGDSIRVSATQVQVVARHEHSPQKALLLSILPGAGQVYNHQAWKIPIVYAALGGVGYYCYYNYTNMRQFKTEYLYRQQHGGATQLAGYESYPTANIYNMYESYNKYFQLSLFGIAAVYGLNLVDAYVFGHLFDFELNDDISLHLSPMLQPTPEATFASGIALTLSIR